MTTDDRLTLGMMRRAVAQLEENAIKPDADGYYDIEKIRAAIGVKQPITFESPPQTFENPIGFTAEDIVRARHDPDAFIELVMRRDPRPSPPAGAAARAWEHFCERQAHADAVRFCNAAKAAGVRLAERLNERAKQRLDALDRAVSELTRFIEPSAEELSRLRQALADEARRLAQTSGHTFESALARVTDMLSTIVVRPQWEDLREQVERLAAGLRPVPEVFVGIDLAAREPLFPPIPSAARRPRNKYAARPPGKR